MGEPPLRCKLNAIFARVCTSFPRPHCSNKGFRKGAERDAVTNVDAGRASGDEGLTKTRGARGARRKKERDFWQDRGETPTPDYILLGLEDPVRPFVLENDGERQQRTARNGESFSPTRPPCVEQ